MNLFAYGTLIFDDIWQCVVGRTAESKTAELSGYSVRQVVDDLYPVMISGHPKDRAFGLVYVNLTEKDFILLDEYEAYLYERIEVLPVLENGSSIACQTYVLCQEHYSAASEQTWTVDWFAQHAKAEYMKRLSR